MPRSEEFISVHLLAQCFLRPVDEDVAQPAQGTLGAPCLSSPGSPTRHTLAGPF